MGFQVNSQAESGSMRSFLRAQQVKDPAWSQLWRGFDPWPGNFHMLCRQPKKKIKEEYIIIIIILAAAQGMQKFLGQGSNLHQGCNQSHSSDNARSLTH